MATPATTVALGADGAKYYIPPPVQPEPKPAAQPTAKFVDSAGASYYLPGGKLPVDNFVPEPTIPQKIVQGAKQYIHDYNAETENAWPEGTSRVEEFQAVRGVASLPGKAWDWLKENPPQKSIAETLDPVNIVRESVKTLFNPEQFQRDPKTGEVKPPEIIAGSDTVKDLAVGLIPGWIKTTFEKGPLEGFDHLRETARKSPDQLLLDYTILSDLAFKPALKASDAIKNRLLKETAEAGETALARIPKTEQAKVIASLPEGSFKKALQPNQPVVDVNWRQGTEPPPVKPGELPAGNRGELPAGVNWRKGEGPPPPGPARPGPGQILGERRQLTSAAPDWRPGTRPSPPGPKALPAGADWRFPKDQPPGEYPKSMLEQLQDKAATEKTAKGGLAARRMAAKAKGQVKGAAKAEVPPEVPPKPLVAPLKPPVAKPEPELPAKAEAGAPFKVGDKIKFQHGKMKVPRNGTVVNLVNNNGVWEAQIQPRKVGMPSRWVKAADIYYADQARKEGIAAFHKQFEGMPKDVRMQTKIKSRDFKRLVNKNVLKFMDEGEMNHTLGNPMNEKEISMAEDALARKARRFAFEDLGLDSDPESAIEQAGALSKLREHLMKKGNTEFNNIWEEENAEGAGGKIEEAGQKEGAQGGSDERLHLRDNAPDGVEAKAAEVKAGPPPEPLTLKNSIAKKRASKAKKQPDLLKVQREMPEGGIAGKPGDEDFKFKVEGKGQKTVEKEIKKGGKKEGPTLSFMGLQGIYEGMTEFTKKVAEKVKRDRIGKDTIDWATGKGKHPNEGLAQPTRAFEGRAQNKIINTGRAAQNIHNIIGKVPEKTRPRIFDLVDKALRSEGDAWQTLYEAHPELAHTIKTARQDLDEVIDLHADEIEKIYKGKQKADYEAFMKAAGEDLKPALTGKVAKETRKSGTIDPESLVKIARKSKGSYLRRHYTINLDRTYAPSESQWQKAVDGLISDDSVNFVNEDQAKGFLNGLLNKRNYLKHDGYLESTINQSPYFRRADVPDYLRQFLGEVKDPGVNYYLTMKDLVTNHSKMKIFDEFKDLKSMFFDRVSAHASENVGEVLQISKDPRSYLWGAISDKYTTPEIADYLSDLKKIGDEYDNLYYKCLSTAKGVKTIFNAPTQIKNVMGNVENSILGGISVLNPLNLGHYKNAFMALIGKNPELKTWGIKARVIETEFAHEEIISAAHALQEMGIDTSGWLGKSYRAAEKPAAALYSGTDQLFKLAAFDKYIKAGMTERNAVTRVYQNFPNFSEVARLTDRLRRSPFAGAFPFISFGSEQYRIFNNAIRAGGTRSAMAVGLASWRAGYNLAFLMAEGYTLKKSMEFMWDNGLFYSNLMADKLHVWAATNTGAFDPNMFNPKEQFKYGKNMLFDPLNQALRSDVKPATKAKNIAYSINTQTGAIVEAAQAPKGEKISTFFKKMSPVKKKRLTAPLGELAKRTSRPQRPKRKQKGDW